MHIVHTGKRASSSQFVPVQQIRFELAIDGRTRQAKYPGTREVRLVLCTTLGPKLCVRVRLYCRRSAPQTHTHTSTMGWYSTSKVYPHTALVREQYTQTQHFGGGIWQALQSKHSCPTPTMCLHAHSQPSFHLPQKCIDASSTIQHHASRHRI
jgi:hypothetical protein